MFALVFGVVLLDEPLALQWVLALLGMAIHGYRRAVCIKANTSTSSSITRTTAM